MSNNGLLGVATVSTPYQHKRRESWETEEYDSGLNVAIRIDCNARDRKGYLKNRKFLIDGLMDSGDLIPTRCDCTHCLNDWDCCGRLIGYQPKVIPVKGGVLVRQYAARNL